MAVRFKVSYFLVIIFLLGLFLRVVKLDTYPAAISWDEVAIGYNAFSIAQKGIDEYQISHPLLFRSFDDYKLPGYVYTDAVFIKLFGFSDFVVRLPSAVFGALSIIVIFLLFKKLFNEKIGIISSFLLAISPWSLQFSRGAFEANLGLFVTLLGVTLLFYGFKNKYLAFMSISVLFSSLYFYYSQRLIVPLITIGFFILFWKEIRVNFKQYILGFLFAIVILIPIVLQILGPHGFKRVNEVSITADKSVSIDYILAREKNSSNSFSFLINRRIPYVIEATHNYFQHFSFGFLFFGDDPNPRQRSYAHGLFYIVEIPLLVYGFFLLLTSKKRERKLFILFWILIAPIASALSKEAPHGLRSLLLLPPLILLIALSIEKFAKSKKITFLLTFFYLIFFINYAISYYFVYPVTSIFWGYGYKQMYQKVFSIEKNYKKIIITGEYWKPRIYYQYYKKILPENIIARDDFEILGKYYFASAVWDGGKSLTSNQINNVGSEASLIVFSDKEFESLKDKSIYKKIDQVRDYSGRKVIFVITKFEPIKNTIQD